MVDKGKIELIYIPIDKMIANGLIKPLIYVKFYNILE